MIMFDKLCYTSKIRNVNPSIKSIFAIGSLLACVTSQSFFVSTSTLLIMGALTIYFSELSLIQYIKLIFVPLIFLMLSTTAIFFNISKAPQSLFYIHFNNLYVTISQDTFSKGIKLILTSLSSISCLYFISINTSTTDIIYVLKKLHIPALIIELMLLIYRFIFLLLELSNSISTAQKCRLGHKNIKSSLYSHGKLLSCLLIRALQKSSKLYDSMEARCYDGVINVIYVVKPINKVIFTLILIYIIILFIVGYYCI